MATYGRQWTPLVEPKTGRPPSELDRWAAENPGASRAEYEARAIHDAVMRLGDLTDLGALLDAALVDVPLPALSSSDHGDDVTVDPDSVQFGPPPPGGRRRAPASGDRPFRGAVDAWLARGGWAAGEAGMASLEVEYADNADRERIRARWRYELINIRGWSAQLVTTKFADGARGEKRMYWWTTAKGRATEMPPSPEGVTS